MSDVTYEVDQVIYWENHSGLNTGFGLTKIQRLTKTQAVLVSGTKLSMKTGSVVGAGQWNRITYRDATEEDRLKVKSHRKLRKIQGKLAGMQWDSCSLDTLNHIEALLYPPNPLKI
jgi:hypothetical protein